MGNVAARRAPVDDEGSGAFLAAVAEAAATRARRAVMEEAHRAAAEATKKAEGVDGEGEGSVVPAAHVKVTAGLPHPAAETAAVEGSYKAVGEVARDLASSSGVQCAAAAGGAAGVRARELTAALNAQTEGPLPAPAAANQAVAVQLLDAQEVAAAAAAGAWAACYTMGQVPRRFMFIGEVARDLASSSGVQCAAAAGAAAGVRACALTAALNAQTEGPLPAPAAANQAVAAQLLDTQEVAAAAAAGAWAACYTMGQVPRRFMVDDLLSRLLAASLAVVAAGHPSGTTAGLYAVILVLLVVLTVACRPSMRSRVAFVSIATILLAFFLSSFLF